MKTSTISILQKLWTLNEIIIAGEFKSAASKIDVTTSALTQTIKSLESHFEQTLIIRKKGSVELTPAGREILEKAKPLLEQLASFNDEYSKGDLKNQKRLRLGAYDTLAIDLFPSLYADLSKEKPEMKFDIQTRRSSELCTLVHQGHLDMALVISPESNSSYTMAKIGENSLSLYAHKSNANHRDMELGCISSESSGRQSFLTKAFEGLNLSSRDLKVQADSFEVLLPLCLKGHIKTILPKRIANRHRDELIDISDQYLSDQSKSLEELTKHSIYLITRQNFSDDLRRQIELSLKA